MKQKSLINLIFIAFLLTSSLQSCIKDGNNILSQTKKIYGVWEGTYSQEQFSLKNSYKCSFVIYSDGSIITKGKADDQKLHYSEGVWRITSDGVFTALIKTINIYNIPVRQEIRAQLNKDGVLLLGTWRNLDSSDGIYYNGTYSNLYKVK